LFRPPRRISDLGKNAFETKDKQELKKEANLEFNTIESKIKKSSFFLEFVTICDLFCGIKRLCPFRGFF